MSDTKSRKLLPDKILFTLLIVLLYLIARKIPLCGVDTQVYRTLTPESENFIMQAIGGDTYQYSLLALGISPYIFSGIIIQFYSAYKKTVRKARVSSRRMNRLTMLLTMGIAVMQAFPLLQELRFKDSALPPWCIRAVAGTQLIAGVALIIWWADRNKKYGIGGQTAIILVNILDRIRGALLQNAPKDLLIPCLVAFFVMLVMLVMENAELRIPLQRVSIHNIYSDKNYLAMKLNPVGVMPVMFAGSFFVIPQILVKGLLVLFPDNTTFIWWTEHMTLNDAFGILIYLLNLYLMTVLFALIVLSPGELAEQFLQSGDSIVGLHAGRDTGKYLRLRIVILSSVSASVMGVCIGIPLFLQLGGRINSELTMFPTSVMMLTGLACNLYREAKAVSCYDAYDTFL